MKRQILILAALFCALVSFTSCEVDTSSSSWLDGTGWEADLKGYVLDGESISGSLRLYFKNGGYEFQGGYGQFNEAWGTYNNSFRTFSETLPEYDFPKLVFTMDLGSGEGAVSNTGILSDDLKSIHFDSFKLPGEGGDSFTDLNFVRKN